MDRQKSILVLAVVLSCASVCFGKYSGGTGEPNDPYLIATAEDMNAIGADSNDWDKHFLLVADINLAEYTGTQFNIIGYYSRVPAPFSGVFDGGNHKVWNFTWTSTGRTDIGLFGYVGSGGQVKNLGMEDVNVNALNGYFVGGLVGSNDGAITNCYSTGIVSGDASIGGLVGWNCGTISDGLATGSVSGNWVVGGLLGCNGAWNGYYGTISNSLSTGSVSGGKAVGGLVGGNYSGMVLNCYATGIVDGNDYIGGLVGVNDQGSIWSCYSTSSVLGSWGVGGLVGDGDANDVFSSFWDVNTSGQTSSAGGEGKTTVEMQTEGIFTDAGWNFVEIWDIGENQTYPFLRVYPAGDINHDDIVNFYDLAILANRWLEEMGQ